MDLRDIYAFLRFSVVPLSSDGQTLAPHSASLEQMRVWQKEFPNAGLGIDLAASGIFAVEDTLNSTILFEPYNGYIRTARLCYGRKQYTLIRRFCDKPSPRGSITSTLPLPPSIVNGVAAVWRGNYHPLQVGVRTMQSVRHEDNKFIAEKYARDTFTSLRDPPQILINFAENPYVKQVLDLFKSARKTLKITDVAEMTDHSYPAARHAIHTLGTLNEIVQVTPWGFSHKPGGGWVYKLELPYR